MPHRKIFTPFPVESKSANLYVVAEGTLWQGPHGRPNRERTGKVLVIGKVCMGWGKGWGLRKAPKGEQDSLGKSKRSEPEGGRWHVQSTSIVEDLCWEAAGRSTEKYPKREAVGEPPCWVGIFSLILVNTDDSMLAYTPNWCQLSAKHCRRHQR